MPAAWVRESTQPYSDATVGRGYGYLWWTAAPNSPPGALGAHWFSAVGAGGQYAFVLPAFDLVVVSRVDRDFDLPAPSYANAMVFVRQIIEAGHLDQAAR